MKKSLMMAMSLSISVPVCAAEAQIRAMFDHLVGKQDPQSAVQQYIDLSVHNILTAPQGSTANEAFMNEFAEFLQRIFYLSLQQSLAMDPTPLAQKLTDILIETVEWSACKPYRIDWSAINPAALPAGYFSDYVPTILAPGLAKAVRMHGQPQLIRTRFGGLVMNLAQIAMYIHTLRDVLQQVDKGLAIVEQLASNPASSLSAFATFASAAAGK